MFTLGQVGLAREDVIYTQRHINGWQSSNIRERITLVHVSSATVEWHADAGQSIYNWRLRRYGSSNTGHS